MTVGAPAVRSDPVRITAMLRTPLSAPPMLDGLLAFVEAQRAGLVHGFGDVEEIEIPIARAPGGAFHLVSGPIWEPESHELRWVNRKFPLAEAQLLGDAKLRRVPISAGPCKSYRIPQEVAFAKDDRIVWYALGEAERIRDLLGLVTHLGRKRGVGRGAVDMWFVEPCDPWDAGFPVVRDGLATRPLPIDWPGLVDPAPGYATLTYPYHQHEREDLCAIPTNGAM